MPTWTSNGESKKFTLESMRASLREAQTASRRFDANILLMRLECEYKQYIAGHSKAYLSGSPWYVGDSLVCFLEQQHLVTQAVRHMMAAEEEKTAHVNSTTLIKYSLLSLIGNTIVIPWLHVGLT